MEKNKSGHYVTNTLNFISDKNPAFYKHYPRLFQSYFSSSNNNEVMVKLCSAGYLYYQSILFTDSVLDDNDFTQFPLISICQEEAIKILSSIYHLDSKFWDYWRIRKDEYYFALKKERQIFLSKRVRFKDYEEIADKKSAFGKIAIDSLYVLSDFTNEEVHKKLILAHRYFSIGFQLYDDVKDFFEDYNKRQFNWGLHSLAGNLTIAENNLPISVKHKLFYIRGTAQKILKKAINFLNKALRLSKDEHCSDNEWITTIREMIVTIKKYRDIINGYVGALIAREQIRKNEQSGHFFNISEVDIISIRSGLNFIRSSFQENYSELKHYMYLSKWDGFSNKTEIHISDTFQRALLNDCLISVAKKHNLNISRYIQNEIDYMLCRIQKDKIGGWSYFPTVKEIAADIDDLGQVIQLFVNSKKLDLAQKYCLNPIRVALTERVRNDGGIETWIIPREPKTKAQKTQEYFNRCKWGVGPDVEVVANFIYSLIILNKKEYTQHIDNSLSYISQAQHTDGYWESRWYYGKYYGTYVCLRLLSQFHTNELRHIKNRALRFIYNSQHTDGGFGLNDVSDAMNTSLALMSLKIFKNRKCLRSIKLARDFLLESQQTDGSWKGTHFIKPKTNEPYKSNTLTTAIALKALSI